MNIEKKEPIKFAAPTIYKHVIKVYIGIKEEDNAEPLYYISTSLNDVENMTGTLKNNVVTLTEILEREITLYTNSDTNFISNETIKEAFGGIL